MVPPHNVRGMDTINKLPPCCARRGAAVRTARSEVARLARVAARNPEGISPKMRRQLDTAKTVLHEAQIRELEHLEDETLEHR